MKDNGCGISEDNLPLIFERFFNETHSSTEDLQGGTGLGLSIIKEIIEGHKGGIWAESKVGEGS